MPRDVATRAIFKVVYEHNLGIDGKPMVYLDLTHIDSATLDRKLEGILEIYEKFVGDDPRKVPMKIFPGMHYTMGGLWVDFNQATNISGVYAAGECEYQYHGAQPAGRKLAGLVHFWWIHCRAQCHAVCAESSSSGKQRSLRGRAQEAGRKTMPR